MLKVRQFKVCFIIGFEAHPLHMAPKSSTSTLPRAMEELKRHLGADATPDGIKNAPPDVRTRAFSALNSTLKGLHGAKYADYKAITDAAKKREWMINYILDPASGGSVAENVTERSSEDINAARTQWVTLEELASPRFYNSVDNAKLAAKDLPSRLHEKPSLASAGVLQYEETMSFHDSVTSLKETARLKLQSALNADEYTEARAHMASGSSDAPRLASATEPKGKKPKTMVAKDKDAAGVPAVPTPDDKLKAAALVKANEELDKALKTARAWQSKMSKELGEVHLVQQKLRAKIPDWGDAPLNFLTKHVETQKVSATELLELWGAASKIHMDNTIDATEKCNAAASLVADHQRISLEYKVFVSTVLKEFVTKK
jgi:hypothetical protein